MEWLTKRTKKVGVEDEQLKRRKAAVDEAVSDTSVPPDVRVKAYDQAMQEYLNARREADKKKNIEAGAQTVTDDTNSLPPSPAPPSPTDTPHVTFATPSAAVSAVVS